jgi:hypothetical protein
MLRLAAASAALLLATAPAPAPAQGTDARAIIQKAVDAQGGFDKMTRAQGSYARVKGVFASDNFKFIGETWSDTGKRFKNVLCNQDDNDFQIYTLVCDGAKSWHGYNGAARLLETQKRQRLEKSNYTSKVTGLVSLLRDKGYTLTVTGDAVVKDAKTVVVKVQSPGQYDVLLYFNKASGLLVKSTYRLVDFSTGQEAVQEVYYGDIKAYDLVGADLRTLQNLKQSADGDALLTLLRARIPTRAERERMTELAEKLGDVKFAVREKVSAELEKFGVKAAALLRQLALSEDLEVSRRAEHLLERVTKGEAALLTAALRVLAARRPAGTVEVLLAYRPWACDDTVARGVLNALDAVNEAAGAPHPTLLAALKDGDTKKREAAAAVLGKDGSAYLQEPWRRLYLDGLLLPHHLTIYRDGKLHLDYEVFEFQFYNRLDDSVFASPRNAGL